MCLNSLISGTVKEHLRLSPRYGNYQCEKFHVDWTFPARQVAGTDKAGTKACLKLKIR